MTIGFSQGSYVKAEINIFSVCTNRIDNLYRTGILNWMGSRLLESFLTLQKTVG